MIPCRIAGERPAPAQVPKPLLTPRPAAAEGGSAGRVASVTLNRIEPWPRRSWYPIRWRGWSAPAHLSWVAGGGPVEPHTEVADHVRLYDDGNGRAGRARALDPAGGGARRRVARGADIAL